MSEVEQPWVGLSPSPLHFILAKTLLYTCTFIAAVCWLKLTHTGGNGKTESHGFDPRLDWIFIRTKFNISLPFQHFHSGLVLL